MGRRNVGDRAVNELIQDRLDVVLGGSRPDPVASPDRMRPATSRRAGEPDGHSAVGGPVRGRRVSPDSDAEAERHRRPGLGRQGDEPAEASPSAGPPDPDDLLGPVGPPPRWGGGVFGRWHVAVLAALVAIGLACTGWAVLRARPVALAEPLPVLTTPAPGSAGTTEPGPGRSPAPPTPSAGAADSIAVHVLGAVRRPGVVQVEAKARVQDALAAAGGLRGNADPDELNLAQILLDGQQVVIGTRAHPAGLVRDGSTGNAGSASGPGADGRAAPGADDAAVVDLNQATEAQLDALPGVGPVTAGRILAWRTEHGGFAQVEDLQSVDGIGPKTYAQLRPHVRV